MAKPPCARLTKPISPMVTDRPTETMNSTIPAAMPPSSMLTRLFRSIKRNRRPGSFPGRRRSATASSVPLLLATALGQLLAHVLDRVDDADVLLVEAAVLLDDLAQVLVHDDVPGPRIDRDRTARAVVFPAAQRVDRGVRIDLALERGHHVGDR